MAPSALIDPTERSGLPHRGSITLPNATGEVETLGLDAEDPFTLETFASIIKQHHQKGQDFLLAQVRTKDTASGRFFWSYYSAHQLNKLIFRTEHDMLHRIRVLNPMNNMMIVGDVYYYAVSVSPKRQNIHRLSRGCAALLKHRLSAAGPKYEPGDRQCTADSFSDHGSSLAARVLDSHDCGLKPLIRAASDATLATESCGALAKDVLSLKCASPAGGPRTHESAERAMKSDDGQARCVRSRSLYDVRQDVSLYPDAYQIWCREECLLNVDDGSAGSSQEETEPLLLDDPDEVASAIYEVRYVGTDDDFMMKSSLRQVFAKNALDSKDARLFSVHETGEHIIQMEDPEEASAETASSRRQGQRDTSWPNVRRPSYSAIPVGQLREPLLSNEAVAAERGPINWKARALALYVGTGFVFMALLFPASYASAVALLMLVLLCAIVGAMTYQDYHEQSVQV